MKFDTFGKRENPDIRCHDLQHEELLTQYPEKWVEEIRRCCGFNGAGGFLN